MMLFPMIFPVPVDHTSLEEREYYREKTRQMRDEREAKEKAERDRISAERQAVLDAKAAAKKVVDDARLARWNATVESIQGVYILDSSHYCGKKAYGIKPSDNLNSWSRKKPRGGPA